MNCKVTFKVSRSNKIVLQCYQEHICKKLKLGEKIAIKSEYQAFAGIENEITAFIENSSTKITDTFLLIFQAKMITGPVLALTMQKSNCGLDCGFQVIIPLLNLTELQATSYKNYKFDPYNINAAVKDFALVTNDDNKVLVCNVEGGIRVISQTTFDREVESTQNRPSRIQLQESFNSYSEDENTHRGRNQSFPSTGAGTYDRRRGGTGGAEVPGVEGPGAGGTSGGSEGSSHSRGRGSSVNRGGNLGAIARPLPRLPDNRGHQPARRNLNAEFGGYRSDSSHSSSSFQNSRGKGHHYARLSNPKPSATSQQQQQMQMTQLVQDTLAGQSKSIMESQNIMDPLLVHRNETQTKPVTQLQGELRDLLSENEHESYETLIVRLSEFCLSNEEHLPDNFREEMAPLLRRSSRLAEKRAAKEPPAAQSSAGTAGPPTSPASSCDEGTQSGHGLTEECTGLTTGGSQDEVAGITTQTGGNPFVPVQDELI